MGQAELCPQGAEVTTKDECECALQKATELGITLPNRKFLVAGSWGHVPHQCSWGPTFDPAFHFNSMQTTNVPDFVMICKKGKCILFITVQLFFGSII